MTGNSFPEVTIAIGHSWTENFVNRRCTCPVDIQLSEIKKCEIIKLSAPWHTGENLFRDPHTQASTRNPRFWCSLFLSDGLPSFPPPPFLHKRKLKRARPTYRRANQPKRKQKIPITQPHHHHHHHHRQATITGIITHQAMTTSPPPSSSHHHYHNVNHYHKHHQRTMTSIAVLHIPFAPSLTPLSGQWRT